MKVSELEKINVMKAIPREWGQQSRTVSILYWVLKSTLLQELEMIQISSCEELLINTKRIDERNVIQRETLIFEINSRAATILIKNRAKIIILPKDD